MELLAELTKFLNDLKPYKEFYTFKLELEDKKQKELSANSPPPLLPRSLWAHVSDEEVEKDRREKEELEADFEEIRLSLVETSGSLESHIKEIIGKDTLIIHEFGESREVNVWDMGLNGNYDYRGAEALDACINYTVQAIGKLKAQGKRQKVEKAEGVKAIKEQPKAFLAHGGKTEARDKLERFLEVLGVTSFIIDNEPKEGRSVNQQVEHYLSQADCAIVLGTADDNELKDGKLYPRRNVHIEIGRCQEKFPEKTIYLLEKGASFSSNISEKVYIPFTQNCMDEAFIAIVKELRNFGLI